MLGLLLLAGLGLAVGFAQAPPGTSPGGNGPVFDAAARLVEVSVYVSDKGGPVLGLSRDDFEVRDNGKRQPIAFFTAPRRDLETRPTPAAAEMLPGSTMIVLDWLNTEGDRELYIRQNTLQLLQHVAVSDQVALLINRRHIETLHDFTDDTAALLDQVRRLKAAADRPTDTPTAIEGPLRGLDTLTPGDRTALRAMDSVDKRIRLDATQTSMDEIITKLAARPGRRTLIWVSDAAPRITSRMRANNIAFYLVNARGVMVRPLPDTNHPDRPRSQLDMSDLIRQDVESTGGRYYDKRNDLDRAMEEAMAETRYSYTLAYYVPADAKLDPPGPKESRRPERQLRIDLTKRAAAKHKVALRYRKSYDPSLMVSPR